MIFTPVPVQSSHEVLPLRCEAPCYRSAKFYSLRSSQHFLYLSSCEIVKHLSIFATMAPSLCEVISEPVRVQKDLKSAAIPNISSCCPKVTCIEHSDIDLSQSINPSLQVTADHRIKMVDAPVYRPARGEVLLHIKATGICG